MFYVILSIVIALLPMGVIIALQRIDGKLF